MIARASFEKSLPRFASAAPFLCLIELHLLCPDMPLLSNELQETLVDARIVRQLRVERGDDEASLAQQHRLTVEVPEHLDLRPDLVDAGCADEDAPQGLGVVGKREVGLEARDLAAVGVAVDLDVDRAEVPPVEDDHPGAGAEHGAGELTHRLVESVQAHQAHEGRRLATGDHEPVETLQLLGLANLDGVRTEPPQHRRVLPKVSLHRQDSDLHQADCRFGRVARSAHYRSSAAGIAPRWRRARSWATTMKTSPSAAYARGAAHMCCRFCVEVVNPRNGKKKSPNGKHARKPSSAHLSARCVVIRRTAHAASATAGVGRSGAAGAGEAAAP